MIDQAVDDLIECGIRRRTDLCMCMHMHVYACICDDLIECGIRRRTDQQPAVRSVGVAFGGRRLRRKPLGASDGRGDSRRGWRRRRREREQR